MRETPRALATAADAPGWPAGVGDGSATVSPLARASSSACSRNSGEYLLGRPISTPSLGASPRFEVSTEAGQLQANHELRQKRMLSERSKCGCVEVGVAPPLGVLACRS